MNFEAKTLTKGKNIKRKGTIISGVARLIITATNYTKYMFDNSLDGDY